MIIATWMVFGCTTNFTNTNKDGCYGFWESNRWGLKRGTIAGKNTDYKKPYRQCVDEDDDADYDVVDDMICRMTASREL